MTDDQQRHAARNGEGLALPVRAEKVGSADTQPEYSFGWCLVDANNRVVAPYLNQMQAEQMVKALSAPSETRPTAGQWVPEQPTEAMIAAWRSACRDSRLDDFLTPWKAILAAAPQTDASGTDRQTAKGTK